MYNTFRCLDHVYICRIPNAKWAGTCVRQRRCTTSYESTALNGEIFNPFEIHIIKSLLNFLPFLVPLPLFSILLNFSV